MDPIKLNEDEILVVTNFDSEDAKIPFESSSTYIGYLQDGKAGYVYSVKSSATCWHLFGIFGSILGRIPINVDTFGKLRAWCAGGILGRE